MSASTPSVPLGPRMTPLLSWIVRVAQLNLLWLGFTLVGLVVGGLFPATVAMYSLARRWLLHPETTQEQALPYFAGEFRSQFFRANAFGYPLTAIGLALYYDLSVTAGMPGAWSAAVFYASVAVAVLYVATLVHVPFFLVHVTAPWWALIRSAWLFAMARPISTAIPIAMIVGLSFVFGAVPAALPFAAASLVCLTTVALDLRAYAAIAAKSTQPRDDDEELVLKFGEVTGHLADVPVAGKRTR